jgi:hypothetical protein
MAFGDRILCGFLTVTLVCLKILVSAVRSRLCPFVMSLSHRRDCEPIRVRVEWPGNHRRVESNHR